MNKRSSISSVNIQTIDSFKNSNENSDCTLEGKILLDYLKDHSSIQNKIEFYAVMKISQIQSLFKMCFESDNVLHDDLYFLHNLLKKNCFIIFFAFNNVQFNPFSLFGFLRSHPTQQRLCLLEDILISFLKQYSEKFLMALQQNKQLAELISNKIYLKSTFKIIYTSIFCIDKQYLNKTKNINKIFIKKMIQAIFIYAPNMPKRPKFVLTEITDLFKQFIVDLTVNLSSVELTLVLVLIEQLRQNKIQEMLNLFFENQKLKQSNEYCQGIIEIFYQLMRLLQTIKLSDNNLYSADDIITKTKLEELIEDLAKQMAKKLTRLISIVIKDDKKLIQFSSGEKIKTVGMIRYRILEMIEKILSINEIVNLQIDFSKLNIFELIEVTLERYKWNNITHILLIKITELAMSQAYNQFKRQYLQNKNYKFFSTMIICFRNPKHFFLQSMRMCSVGNLMAIFEISKTVINELQEEKDLNHLLKQFKHCRQFIQNDMKQFQCKHFEGSSHFLGQNFDKRTVQKLISATGFYLSTPSLQFHHHHRPLQKIQEILSHLEDQKRWSSRVNQKSKAKEEFLNLEYKDIDSMHIYSTNQK